MKFCRKVILNATLLGALLLPTSVLPCFGQQEMDPTWYDPWAPPRMAVTSPSQPNVAHRAAQKPAILRASARGKRQRGRPTNVMARRAVAAK
jgi:hypothetical protein